MKIGYRIKLQIVFKIAISKVLLAKSIYGLQTEENDGRRSYFHRLTSLLRLGFLFKFT